MRLFSKIAALLLVIVFATCNILSISATDSNVTYDGNSQEFIFSLGSEFSPSDLFVNFKDVMPGDSISQKITVKNDASKNIKVKIYMRSLGAEQGSEDFLSKLNLRVEKLTDTELFDAPANETAQLADWAYLGLLYSGGEAELNVILDVPNSLDNEYKDRIGYLDWEFKVEELPVEPDDPRPPQTGDSTNLTIYVICFVCSAALIIILLFKRRSIKNR